MSEISSFEEFVQSIRDAVSIIDQMPESEINPPLAQFRDSLRANLEDYDRAKERKSQ